MERGSSRLEPGPFRWESDSRDSTPRRRDAVHAHTIALEDVSKRAQALTTAPEAGTNQVQAFAIQLAGDATASYAGPFGLRLEISG
jgi:hypothetical protein